MPDKITFTAPAKAFIDDGADNLVALVDYLQAMKSLESARPRWAKFDTRTTMSDNNGGLIKF